MRPTTLVAGVICMGLLPATIRSISLVNFVPMNSLLSIDRRMVKACRFPQNISENLISYDQCVVRA